MRKGVPSSKELAAFRKWAMKNTRCIHGRKAREQCQRCKYITRAVAAGMGLGPAYLKHGVPYVDALAEWEKKSSGGICAEES